VCCGSYGGICICEVTPVFENHPFSRGVLAVFVVLLCAPLFFVFGFALHFAYEMSKEIIERWSLSSILAIPFGFVFFILGCILTVVVIPLCVLFSPCWLPSTICEPKNKWLQKREQVENAIRQKMSND
jgi:hypothetical protein